MCTIFIKLLLFLSLEFIQDRSEDQRPEYRGSFADKEITFHDPVMMDDERNETKLNKILETYEQAHSKSSYIVGPDIATSRFSYLLDFLIL